MRGLLIIMILLSVSCQKITENINDETNQFEVNQETQEEKSSLEVIGSKAKDEEIRIVSNHGVEFDFELKDTTEFGENFMIKLDYVIRNKSHKSLYYLNQSCNKLDYYLKIKPNNYKVSPFLHCNATNPIINELHENDSIERTTQILMLNNSDSIQNIGIDFRVVDRFAPFDTLYNNQEIILKSYRSKTDKKNIIWHKKK